MHEKNHVHLMILKGNISIIRLEKLIADALLMILDTYSCHLFNLDLLT